MAMEEPQDRLRRAEAELTIATAKVDMKSKRVQHVQYQVQRLEGDAEVAKSREGATDRLLQHLQSALGHLEARKEVSSQGAEPFRGGQAPWVEKLVELRERCAALEEEKFQALEQVRESFQVAEEATLQRDLAWLKESRRMDEWKETEKAIGQLIQAAAVRTREEVDKVRKRCDARIKSMAEELSALRLECADKDSQIQRSLRERKAAEEELERVYREGGAEPDSGKMDALHQRCLKAERSKDDMSLILQSTQRRLTKLDLDYGEETTRRREEVRRLRDALNTTRDDCLRMSDERLRMQQENLRLAKETDELKKRALQREEEHRRKEQALKARMEELEERSSGAELTRLVPEQHRSIQNWREEAGHLVRDFETTILGLRSQLSLQERRSSELETQRAKDLNAIASCKRQLQERMSFIQTTTAADASQQLGLLTSSQSGKTPDPWLASVHPGNGGMSYIEMKANSTFNTEVTRSFQSW